ncbi:hypothetical protein E4L96_19970 [Massilia arenosa]|uniref:Uncharacterized domain-containing protein n=1 Tax=Zemynaea arenosa TaxID=2561931 RepID=A0A4Y9RVQ4_9BURK|nr:MobH family relaxase [Massilia arenosa]TFW13377.1 hypothetical protein E4L96_19970 [Massilia arenosa]
MFARGPSHARSAPTPGHGTAGATGADLGRRVEAVEPTALLALNADLLQRIELAFGLDVASFKATVHPIIESLARFVNNLPAKASPPFAHDGGMFRLGLLIGFFALQGTDGQIFSGAATITERRTLDERWRLAVFAAGVCAEMYRAYDLLRVSDSARATWSPHSMCLTDWLAKRDAAYLTWSGSTCEHTATALFSVPHVLPPAILEYFRSGPEKVTAHMLASIAGVATWRSRNLISLLVRDASLAVFDHEQRQLAGAEEPLHTGSHWTGPIVQALQRLANTNATWRPDTAKSRVIHTVDGTYLAWPGFAQDVIGVFEREGLSAMPRHPDDILALLLHSQIIVRGPDGSPYWPLTRSEESSPLLTVKLANPDLLRTLAGSETVPIASAGGNDIDPAPKAQPSDSACCRLQAPLRLHQTVAAGLQRALDELLAHGAQTNLQVHRDGMVVTDSLFTSLRLDPLTAFRSLSEAGMLVRGTDGEILRVQVTGHNPGVVVARKFIVNLPMPEDAC